MLKKLNAMTEDLIFNIRQGWSAYAFLIGLFAVVLGLYIWFYIWRDQQNQILGEQTFAIITSFGVADADQKYRPGWIFVTGVSANGTIGQIAVPQEQLTGCGVGDVIAAEQVGASLRLKPAPCDLKRK